jgi:hypothetical protein
MRARGSGEERRGEAVLSALLVGEDGMSTKQKCGSHAIAIYVDNAQGRRLLVAVADDFAKPVLIAMTQTEAREAIAVLRQLAEELPP